MNRKKICRYEDYIPIKSVFLFVVMGKGGLHTTSRNKLVTKHINVTSLTHQSPSFGVVHWEFNESKRVVEDICIQEFNLRIRKS